MHTQNFHLEMSPRGSGKSYRIIQDILEKSENPNFIAYYAGPNFKIIKISLEEAGFDVSKLIYFSRKEVVKAKEQTTYYFDEFDKINWLKVYDLENIVEANVHFCGSPSKVREISKFNSKIDVFAKLLELNNYFYISKMCINSNLLSKQVIEDGRKSMNEECFEKEFLCKFLK